MVVNKGDETPRLVHGNDKDVWDSGGSRLGMAKI